MSLIPVIDPAVQEFYGGRKVPTAKIAEGLRDAGLKDMAIIDRIAIALWESDGYESAYFLNYNGDGTVRSIDRGLFQINSASHNEVSDADAYYWHKACAIAARLVLTQWVSWNRYLAPEAMTLLAGKAAQGDQVAKANLVKAQDTWRRAILGFANERCSDMRLPGLRLA